MQEKDPMRELVEIERRRDRRGRNRALGCFWIPLVLIVGWFAYQFFTDRLLPT